MTARILFLMLAASPFFATADDVYFLDVYLAGVAFSSPLARPSEHLVLEAVPTTVAWGIGPSLASKVPPAEIEAMPPNQPWSGLLRLHHRSEVFGLVASHGGSNWVTVGVRRRF